MKRNYYIKRYRNKDGDYTIKIYGDGINYVQMKQWRYKGEIRRFKDMPDYYFEPSIFLRGIVASLIEVINKEIQLIKYKSRQVRLK